ncbi:MAG: RnfABCDGE type electron transport complex subunit G [Bacteroidales bacterium]|nr:RnfABCDGE type electron transport complex subunit G [Bacteroidales bacterium]
MKSTMTTMVLSLTIIASAMGAALGLVHDATAAPIAQAQEKAKQEALASVLPGLGDVTMTGPEEVTVKGDSRPVMVYRAMDGNKLKGTAVESWTMDGYSGEIRIMVGFDAKGKIIGYEVLQSAETPGLGAKAGEWFRSEIGNRSIIGTKGELAVSKDMPADTEVDNDANTGASTQASASAIPIDGITAATITSRAFLQAVNRARKATKKK